MHNSLLYTYYTDKNHALRSSTVFVPGSYGLWSNAPVMGSNQFPGTLSGCHLGRAPVSPDVVKCRLIITVISFVVMRKSAALEWEAFHCHCWHHWHLIIQSQFQIENIPSFTCGGFSESSAGYLSSRKTLESCKSRSISQGQRSTLNQKIRGYGQTSDVIFVELSVSAVCFLHYTLRIHKWTRKQVHLCLHPTWKCNWCESHSSTLSSSCGLNTFDRDCEEHTGSVCVFGPAPDWNLRLSTLQNRHVITKVYVAVSFIQKLPVPSEVPKTHLFQFLLCIWI